MAVASTPYGAPQVEREGQPVSQRTLGSISHHAAHPEQIEARLRRLDEEWDLERCLASGAAALSLLGFGLAAARDRRWLFLPASVASLLLQHALQGTCRPAEVLRMLGVRTAREVDEERYALKLLRGDFDRRPADAGAGVRVMEAVRR